MLFSMETKTCSLTDFQKVAQEFARSLAPCPGRATVVGLHGDLGSGKTTFVQAIAKTFGVEETVSSPTFLIFRRYTLHATHFANLIHIDAYRLKSSDELRKLRFDELLADPKNLILVEWADKVANILPKNHLELRFEFIDERTRRIAGI